MFIFKLKSGAYCWYDGDMEIGPTFEWFEYFQDKWLFLEGISSRSFE